MKITSEISKTILNIEEDINKCGIQLSILNSKAMDNIIEQFEDKTERSIALFVYNTFTFYDWSQTKDALSRSLDRFLRDTRDKKIVFLFHREQSSSTNNNACHEKSSFFFTLLSLKMKPELARRTIGFMCEDLSSIHPKTIQKNDTIYCIIEDSIYSGNQLNNMINNLDKKIDKTKIHVVCPFVRELFIQQSESKPYTLHVEVPVQSLLDRFNDEQVIKKTCMQIKKNNDMFDNDFGICRGLNFDVLNTLFPFSIKLTHVYFSHKTADATSIALPWILTILGLGEFSLVDSESHEANTHVKNSDLPVFKCMRGPYKLHKETLFEIFNEIFEESFSLKKKSLLSKLKSII